ncbi:MAG TPA: NAD(P)/FAD-dependent oxidoreductase [Steroidobacteraceae bacterium]|nr:NAD(P)/FAD-dependent oxidoreductase [Steroidobacteraceae bacterium]
MRQPDTDALVIGAGPAGASVAIRLAQSGRRVTLIEQAHYPRQKVCGECLNPASLQLLAELGLGQQIANRAGPEIRQVAWMTRRGTVTATMPACESGDFRYGRAIGRDSLDTLLVEEARALGVRIIQPAHVRRVSGEPGDFRCIYHWRSDRGAASRSTDHHERTVTASIVIDAHGSWERAPYVETSGQCHARRSSPRSSDLLAFKVTFEGTSLSPGVLPVLSLPGGYGGVVVADRGRTTLACCIRRDVLRQWRARAPGKSAAAVVEAYLRDSCPDLAAALQNARRDGPWQSAGPLRPGFHDATSNPGLRIGNASVEAHPLIGEGICMALQSAAALARLIVKQPSNIDPARVQALQRAHARTCRAAFRGRVRLAHLYAQVAMRPWLTTPSAALMRAWPRILTFTALLAGKARGIAARAGDQYGHP